MARSMSPMEARLPWCDRSSGAGIHAEHLGDVWSFMTGAYTKFEGFARLNSADPALNQHASVEEGVTGPIREFNKAKALLGTEPFDDAVDGRT